MRSARMEEPRTAEERGPGRAVGRAFAASLATVPTAPQGQDVARA
jgi:hypothetical protein